MTVVNDRIYDVAGRNPYENKTIFAVTPLKTHLEGNAFTFKIPTGMIYTNVAQVLSSVQVDFGNGQGYQTISLNAEKYVVYPSGGEKEVKVKFVYSGGPTLYSHAKIYVEYVAPMALHRFDGSGSFTEFITGTAFQGIAATGEVTIETAGSDGVLDKPLIVVEGFDPFNWFDYRDLIDDDENGGLEIRISEVGEPLLTLNEAIEAEGYDLVFINYQNGTDFIQRNAFMVEAVIERVNEIKVGNEQNVVLGMSMGALVARYALRHMELTGRTHETKLYISHDGPHQGANVPLAYQAIVRHLAGESIGWPVFLSLFTIDIVDLTEIAPDLQTGLDLLQTPAAQQMLIYQLSGTGSAVFNTSNGLRNSFATEYRNMGYPSQGGIKNIAISNGSECGTPLNFGPYADLADVDMTVDLPFFMTNIVFTVLNGFSINPIRTVTSFLSTDTDVKADFSLKALPNQQSLQIYRGRIFIKKTVLGFINVEEPLINEKVVNSLATMLPMDNSGGGIYDINQFIVLPPQIAQFMLQQRFNFIPTFSSLDIGSGTQAINNNDLARVYSPLSPPVAPKNTPFHNFFTNPVLSENHIQFTLNNGNWLLTELEGDPAFYSCASSCASPPPVTIAGPSLVCPGTTTEFTLNNVSSVAPVAWQVFGKFINPKTGSGNHAELTASSPLGFASNITFTITTGCGNPVVVQKAFWVGNPTITYHPTPPNLNPCSTNPYYAAPAYPGVSYQWAVNNPNIWLISPNNPNVLTLSIDSEYFDISVTMSQGNCTVASTLSNQVGNALYCECFYDPGQCPGQGGWGLFAVYPNPSSDYLDVEIEDEEFVSEQFSSFEMVLFDDTGTEVWSSSSSERSKRIETSGLQNGQYFLHISYRGEVSKGKIVIKR